MTFLADFSKSTFWKAFNPEILYSIQPAASFETNSASIPSKMVEFDIIDCVIAFPEYIIAKFPAKLYVKVFHFLGFKCVTYQVITSKIVNFHRWTTDGYLWNSEKPLPSVATY